MNEPLLILLAISRTSDALGIVLIIFSMFIVAYFLLKTAPLLVKKAWIGVVSMENTVRNMVGKG